MAGIAAIVDRQRLLTRWNGQPAEIALPDTPDLAGLLRAYLWDTPGYDPALPCAEQRSVVSEQHGYVLQTTRHQLRALADGSDTRR